MRFNEQSLSVLSKFWHPVATKDELAETTILPVTLLDHELALFNLDRAPVIAEDRCPHRGTRLSLGTIRDDYIACAYHGLEYDHSGKCVRNPVRPHGSISPRLRLTTYTVAARYGLYWVNLNGRPIDGIPAFPEWEDKNYENTSLAPYVWQTSASRQIETVIGHTHFEFVHSGLLGPNQPAIPPFEIEPGQRSMRIIFKPSGEADVPFWRRTYNVTLPFSVHLKVLRTQTGGYWTLFNTVCPCTPNSVRIFASMAMNFNRHTSKELMREHEDRIYAQDQVIAESMRPVEAPLDLSKEGHLADDAISIAYRKALRDLGL